MNIQPNILPTYYVGHPDGTYSVADPQPVVATPLTDYCPDCGAHWDRHTFGVPSPACPPDLPPPEEQG